MLMLTEFLSSLGALSTKRRRCSSRSFARLRSVSSAVAPAVSSRMRSRSCSASSSLSLQAGQRLAEIPGYVPDSGRETDACIFAPRCPYAGAECSTALQEQDLGGGHSCLCAKPGIGGHDHG